VAVVIVAILIVVWAVAANHSGGPLLIKTSTVNLTYTEGIAIAPNGKRVYTVRLHDGREGAVDVIDTASNHVVGTIDVEEGPTDIAVSPDGRQAYVSYIQVSPNGHLTVIDLASETVTGTIQVNSNVSSVIFSRDGTKAYASLSDRIAVIDVKSQTVTSMIDLPDVGRVAVSPDSRRGYASSYSANQVNVLDLATNQIVDRIPVGSEPGGAAMTPDGRQVYVANAKSGDVSVIDPASDRVVATLPVTTQPNDLAWGVQAAPDGRYAYVRLDSEIVAIDTSTNTVAGRVTEGVFPTGMAITVDGTKAYVSHHSDSVMTVLGSG
jgi:YVTN family beta-propeller protein